MGDTPQAPRPLRAALYARVSTQEQTPENQLLALYAFAQARGLDAGGVCRSRDQRGQKSGARRSMPCALTCVSGRSM